MELLQFNIRADWDFKQRALKNSFKYFFFKCNEAGTVKYFVGPMETLNESLTLLHIWGPVVWTFGLNRPHLPQLDDLNAELLNDSLETRGSSTYFSSKGF